MYLSKDVKQIVDPGSPVRNFPQVVVHEDSSLAGGRFCDA